MDSGQIQYRQHGIYGDALPLFSLAVSLQALVLLAITLRFKSRKMSKAGVGKDDWTALVAVVFNVILTALAIAEVFYGYGYAGNNLSPSDRKTVLQLFWLTQIFYKIVMGCSKLSFCFFYSRVFPAKSNKKFRYWNLGVMSLVISYSVASTVTTIFQCAPVGRIWDKSINGTCINLTAFWLANAIYSIFTDVLIIMLPCVMCGRLQTGKKDKIGLIVVFSLGFFVIGTSLARITTLDIASKSLDPSQGTLLSNTWTTVEANTAIVVACLPSLKAAIGCFFQRIKPITRAIVPSAIQTRYTDHPTTRTMSTTELGKIAIRTDVRVDIEERSSNSSIQSVVRPGPKVGLSELV